MPLRQAQAAVAAMPELTGARTKHAQISGLKRTRMAEAGIIESKVKMSAPANADLVWLRQQLQLGNRDVFERALACYRAEVGLRQGLSDPGADAMAYLLRVSDAAAVDVIDLCLRYVAQELRVGRVVSVT